MTQKSKKFKFFVVKSIMNVELIIINILKNLNLFIFKLASKIFKNYKIVLYKFFKFSKLQIDFYF